jgi:ribA/ribD-fused uncharacterized protein
MNTIKQFRDPLLDTTGTVVGCYEREFYTFSNFSSFQVEWRGQLWPTSEHAYQAAHFFDTEPEFAERIRTMRSAHQAFVFAKSNMLKVLKNWDEVKIDIMEDICRHKLQQHEYVREKLLATNDVLIVEDSPVDSFWGWGADRQGRNELGHVWMRLRQELRASM